MIGDFDATGGISDINAAVHRWLNPVARVTITRVRGAANDTAVGTVQDLSGITYSRSALEIFWQPAITAAGHISEYEVRRNGNVVGNTDGTSFFEQGLESGIAYEYSVTAIDSNDQRGKAASVVVTTN